jgi:predicted hydrocarbon binding protein
MMSSPEQLMKAHPVENADYYPLDIGRLLATGVRKIYGLVVEATPASAWGLSCMLSGISKDYGALIKFIQYSMPNPKEKTVKALIFIDLTDSSISPTELINITKKHRGILSVKLIKPTPAGLLYDSYFFPLTMGYERAVVFRKQIYAALINKIKDRFGTGASAFLYYLGLDIGENAFESYVQLTGSKDIRSLTDIAKAANMVTGWGIVDVVTINEKEKTALVRVYESFECELGKGMGKASSNLYRGALAGFFSRLFYHEVKIEETKCIAKGDKCCEFSIA